MVRAVVFDWGGTLTTYVPVDPVAVWTHAAKCLSPNDSGDLCAALCAAEEALWYAVAHDARSGSLGAIVAAVVAERGLALDPALLDEAAERYLRAWEPYVEHRADAVAALRALRDRGIRTGLLSNTFFPAAFHEDLLARDGLRDLLDVRHYTSEREWMKPRPEAFAAVLRDLGVADPATAVFVGDRPFDDVYGARRAGLRTVQIANEHVPPYDVQPDARITSLAELVALVDAWAA